MIEHFAENLFKSGLLEQAAVVLKQRITNNLQDCETLAKLGEIYRKQGELAKAAEVYAAMIQLTPDDKSARYLQALMAGVAPPARPAGGGFQPAPFLLIGDCLSSDLHRALMPFVLSSQDEFIPSTVNNWVYEPEHSHSLTTQPLGEIYQRVCKAVEATLPKVRFHLQLPQFEIEHIEIEIKAYRHGHFFRTHQDRTPTSKRRINFGYFFHRQPRPYTGGDFLLFDTDFSNNSYLPTRFTRIVPEDNCIIFYPSTCFHEVTPVQCQSDDFGDSRFAIVGHIRESESPSAGDSTTRATP